MDVITARRREAADLVWLTALVLATRIPFRSHWLYDIDSINFALGMRRFDTALHQPHPPGYFFYIMAGRMVNRLFADANAALVAISVAATCGALIMIYALAHTWFGRQAAVFAGLLLVFSPLVWFHGTVALTYSVELFFSALTGLLCWAVYSGARWLVVPLAIVAGAAAGFRPSFLLFLGPLLVLSLSRTGLAAGASGVSALAASVAASFAPMMSETGGLARWWSSLVSLWLTAPGKQTVFNSSPAITLARLISVGGILLLCFGGAAVFAFRRPRIRPCLRPEKTFVLAWIGPCLLFVSLIFLKFVNSGYLLVILPPLFAWLGLRVSDWYASPGIRTAAKTTLLCGVACLNCLVFLFAPVYCSWTAVHHFETELAGIVRSLPEAASPADTMIVGFDSHFLGYRHAGYYLPGFFTVQFPEVHLASGTRVFTMEHGDTHLMEVLPQSRFRNFVFFPLPSDDAEYAEYLKRVCSRFPKDALRTIRAGDREFLTGDVKDLPRLFPVAARVH